MFGMLDLELSLVCWIWNCVWYVVFRIVLCCWIDLEILYINGFVLNLQIALKIYHYEMFIIEKKGYNILL